MRMTVITASFNSEKTIKATIESVLFQNQENFEYIIIDGNSKDSTVNIIKSYESQFNQKNIAFKWISENDKGIYDAWNKGVNLSSGEWISFLGSDDYYLKNALDLYSKAISKNKNLDLIYSSVKLVKGDKVIKIINGTWSWKKFKRYMNIAHVGAFHNKEYFKEYGLFDTSYKIAGDYEFLLRAKENLKALKINELTAIMNDGGLSNNQINKVLKETLRAKNKTAGLSKIVCYYDYSVAFIKYILRRMIYAINR